MIKIIMFLLFLLSNVILLLNLLVKGIRWGVCVLQKKDCLHIISAFKKSSVIFACMLLAMIIFIVITQLTAFTPKIKDGNGKAVDGSIAELRKINLNGHEEWISIRGLSKEAPVLLFLAGGPGGTQLSYTRYELKELEKKFVIVNWDQPGSGKSYHCMKRSNITIQTYIEDGIALTEYLRKEFKQEKIYLMGESWGSALGIFLAKEKPEYYTGFIGTGQMVAFKETEIIDYHQAIEIAKNRKDEEKVKQLIKQGEPPYYEGNIALLSANYLNYLSGYMNSNPEISGGYHTLRDMFASEYGILDSINYLMGIMNTFNVVYPQLYEVDLRKDYTKLEIPVYFFIGRHDINAPTSLAEEYYNQLSAPKKEFVWFELSGHGAIVNETELFVKETLRVFER